MKWPSRGHHSRLPHPTRGRLPGRPAATAGTRSGRPQEAAAATQSAEREFLIWDPGDSRPAGQRDRSD